MVGKERGITPLLAQMYARSLMQIPEVDSGAFHLPTSVPELMLTYLEVLNRAGRDTWGDIEVQRASKRLAWECIRDSYHPGRGSKEEVIYGQQPDSIPVDLFSYLENRLRLIDTVAGVSYQFVLDPLAEYFGAIYLLEQTRTEETAWARFLESLDRVSRRGDETLGFLLALHDSLEWRGSAMCIPSFVIDDVAERLTRAQERTDSELRLES